MPLITDHIDIIESEKYGLRLLNAFRCHGIRILQRRVYHDHSDDRAQIGICAECLCR